MGLVRTVVSDVGPVQSAALPRGRPAQQVGVEEDVGVGLPIDANRQSFVSQITRGVRGLDGPGQVRPIVHIDPLLAGQRAGGFSFGIGGISRFDDWGQS